jgi:ferritin
MKKSLQLKMIEKADAWILKFLAEFVFSDPNARLMTDPLKLMIEKGDKATLNSLAIHTFSQRHTKDMKNLLRLLIEKGDKATLDFLAIYTFSQPHTKDMKDLLRLLIENGDAATLRSLARYTFSQPHTKDMKDLLQLLIEKGDKATLNFLAIYTFSQPHTKDMKDLLRLLIEKGDATIFKSLAYYTFYESHTQDMKDLLKILIERGDVATLKTLGEQIFSDPYSNTPENDVMRRALGISDAVARKNFLEMELAKIGSSLANQKVVMKHIDMSLKVGDYIMIKNRVMKVIKIAGEGHNSIVFQVQAQDNQAFYGLKVINISDSDTLASLGLEASRALKWQQLKIPHAKILVQEKEYLLKAWIEGVNGEQVIGKYFSGDSNYKKSAEGILKLVAKIRDQGAYVGDFRPANLIWNGNAWVIIDSGSIQQGMTLEEAQVKWASVDGRGPKFERRWQLKLPESLSNKCERVLLN